MRKQKEEPNDLLQGTLDLLILRTLLFGPIHGHAIAKSIERLQRMCCEWITARSIQRCSGWSGAA
jgi:hypothetical protein